MKTLRRGNGRGVRRFNVGGIGGGIRLDSGLKEIRFFRQLKGFPARTSNDLEIEVHRVRGLEFWDPDRARGPYRMEVGGDRRKLHCTSYRSFGLLDLREGRGHLWTDRWGADGAAENFIRMLWANLLAARGGVLLHGAGVIRRTSRGRRAYVFFGPSGAGKTTVARLSRGRSALEVVGDDLVILRPMRSFHRRRGVELWSVPFRGGSFRLPLVNTRARLGGLYRLVQSDRHEAVPAPHARATAEIVAAMPFVNDRSGPLHAALEAASRIATQVPCYWLRFRKDVEFWKVVD